MVQLLTAGIPGCQRGRRAFHEGVTDFKSSTCMLCAERQGSCAPQVPGQFVALRLGSSDDASAAAAGNGSSSAAADSTGAAAVLPIASSPIAARADSVNMDASVIEVGSGRQSRR